jgi:hypothetical protein
MFLLMLAETVIQELTRTCFTAVHGCWIDLQEFCNWVLADEL